MKLHRRIFGLAVLSATVGFFNIGGCSASNNSSSDNGPASTIVISPQPASLAVNSNTTFTATTTYATGVSWSLSGTNAGTLSSTTGYTVNYTAPSTPPVYAVGSTVPQGTVQLSGDTTAEYACGEAFQTISFVITAPSITAGIAPTSASITLGGTVDFTAYAVGSVSNGVTVQVNGVTGGSASVGTVGLYPQYNNDQQYQYTAPASMPMTGNKVTITVTSVADPTKSASAVITLQ